MDFGLVNNYIMEEILHLQNVQWYYAVVVKNNIHI